MAAKLNVEVNNLVLGTILNRIVATEHHTKREIQGAVESELMRGKKYLSTLNQDVSTVVKYCDFDTDCFGYSFDSTGTVKVGDVMHDHGDHWHAVCVVTGAEMNELFTRTVVNS